jgi:dihydroorotase-like cyclic amidohydrolase
MSSNSLIVRQATILRPDGSLKIGDVLPRGKTIAAMVDRCTKAADLGIDGKGWTLLPGAIDPLSLEN